MLYGGGGRLAVIRLEDINNGQSRILIYNVKVA